MGTYDRAHPHARAQARWKMTWRQWRHAALPSLFGTTRSKSLSGLLAGGEVSRATFQPLQLLHLQRVSRACFTPAKKHYEIDGRNPSLCPRGNFPSLREVRKVQEHEPPVAEDPEVNTRGKTVKRAGMQQRWPLITRLHVPNPVRGMPSGRQRCTSGSLTRFRIVLECRISFL